MLLQSYKFFVPLLRFFQEIFNSPENMKQILTTLLLVIAFAITADAKSQPVKAYFALEPQITNQNLENKVKTGMRYETGVQAVDVNRQQQIVTIAFDPEKTTVEALIEAFKQLGFTAKTTSAPTPTTCPEGHQAPGCQGCPHHRR